MITNRDKRMATTLARIENSIYRILSEPEIMTRLANYGYDFGAVHSARNLLEEVIRLNRLPDNYDGKERLLLESFKTVKTDFESFYNRHRQLVQEMEDAEAKGIWRHTYPEHPDYEKWLSQADVYGSLMENESIKEAMLKVNVPESELIQARHLIDIMRQVFREYRKQKGSEIKEVVDLEKKIRDLENWYDRFVEINRIAFEGEPQTLEILGIPIAMN
ncbi:hypothetical protein [Prolixibacter bellariivorans]|uniref:hypothetical protein n=1 Tax=Prolixibacter bellariivorans TaxID=314319 RepID=UPI00046FDFA4|nr:hypothetical protein [Prolixibacter bellariivorans]